MTAAPKTRSCALAERAFWVFALALVVLATVVRFTAAYHRVFTPGGIELKPFDSYYYVRFARIQLDSFPRFIPYDAFINFPARVYIIWPPFHALALALVIALAGAGHTFFAASFLGMILTLPELLLVGALARRWFGAPFALAVMTLLVLIPVMIVSSAVGNADHHVNEPYLVALAVLCLARALETGARRDALGLGLVLGLGRFFTTFAFALFPIAALALCVDAVRDREQASRCARTGFAAGGVSALVLGLGVVLFGRTHAFDYASFSLFHPLFALVCLWGASAFCSLRARRVRPAIMLLGGAVAAVLPLVPGLLAALGDLARADPLLTRVEESLPLATRPGWAIQLLGPPLLLLPFALFGALTRIRPGKRPLYGSAVVFTLLLAAAAAAQVRFSQPFSGALAVVTPVGLWALWKRCRPSARKLLAGVLGLALVSLAAMACIPEPPESPDTATLARPMLTWMRTHLPPAAKDPFSPNAKPTGAVVALNVLGHLVLSRTHHPVVASPFSQTPWHIAANERGAQVFIAPTDEAAYRAMKATQARYFLATPFSPVIGHPDVPPRKTWAYQLVENAGLASNTPTEHFRLIRDSAQRLPGQKAPFMRLFEAVPGAVLEGTAAPGTSITLSLELTDNLGRKLRYTRKLEVDTSGRFDLRVPYATGQSTDGGVHTASAYTLEMGNQRLEVKVARSTVLDGSAISVGGPVRLTSTSKNTDAGEPSH